MVQKLNTLDLLVKYTHLKTVLICSKGSSSSYDNFNPTTFDTANLDTSNVTNMSRMFDRLSKLTHLDVTKFDTSKVTNMKAMFYDMSNLTTLDVTKFNTSNVTDMSSMFHHLVNVTELDVTKFDTSNVTNMSNMFSLMGKLTSLDVTHFDTSNVTDMSHLFQSINNVTELDVTKFDTSRVTNMGGMFMDMSKLKQLDVTKFNTSNVTNMGGMFAHTYDLDKLDVTNFDTSNVTNMYGMFQEMTSLTSLDVTKFDTHNVTEMSQMFDMTDKMSNLTELDVSNFDTSQVTEMEFMFRGLSKVTKLDVSHFDTSNVRFSSDIFQNMSKLKELKLGDKFVSEDGIQTIPVQYNDSYPNKWHKVGDPEHLYSVEEWANLYQSDPSGSAGTWVREEVLKDATLTFQGENFTPVKVKPSDTALPTLPRPSWPKSNHKFLGWSKDGKNPITREEVKPGETVTLQPLWQPVDNTKTRTEKISVTETYEADNALDYGKRIEIQGIEGEKTITTTYTVTPYTGELTNSVDSEVITKPMKPTIVKVGTKPTDKVDVIPSPKRYEKDPTRDKGEPDIVTPGKPGSKTTTITYTMNPLNGIVTSKQGEPVIVPATPTIVKVAAKDKTNVEPIPSTVVYEADKTRDKGTPNVSVDGIPGSLTTVTTYMVNPQDGKVTEKVGTPIRKEPTNTIVKVGAKDSVIETPIEPTVVYEKDDTRDEGTPNITIPGNEGKTVTVTTYHVNPKDGTVTEKVGEPVVTPAGVTKVKVGAKTKIEIIKDVGKTIQRTTSYDVDPNIGKVTPHINDKVIGDNGVDTPPTVDIPEYTGVIGGSLDGEGNVITPPKVDKPEYTGAIGGAGLDSEGNVITPPKVDKPFYTGEIEPAVERQVTSAGKRYEKDDSREKGQPDIMVPGKDGLVTTTFHYHVDKDGNVISSKGSSVTEEPVDTIIKIAAKDKVEVKMIESLMRYVSDDTKELGYKSVVPGKPGVERITTIYNVNPETGEISERTEQKLSVAPVETVITKGTKPTVKTVERDGRVYEQTTTYTVNEKTGEVTSSTTEKLIKDIETPTDKPLVPSTDITKPVDKQTEIKKQLPNTGDAGSLTSLVGLGIGLLGIRLGRKRKD